MVRLSRRSQRQTRSPCRGQDGRPHRPALGAPHLLQPQGLGLGRLSRLAPQTSSVLSRRVRLSLQPSPHPPCRVPLPARHRRRSPAHQLQDVDLTGSKSIRLYRERARKLSTRSRRRRKEASQYLRDHWQISRTEKTLAKLATTGGGPRYHLAGRIPLYPEEELDA